MKKRPPAAILTTGLLFAAVLTGSVRASDPRENPFIAKQVIGDVYSPFSWMRY